MQVTSMKNFDRRDYVILLIGMLIYIALYAISVVSKVESVEFMAIDPHSIVDSLHSLTTYPYYNMLDSYHSKYYGWTFFSLNFVILMFSKLLGLVNDETFNIIVRANLFFIGMLLTAALYTLSRYFFSRTISAFAVLYFLVDPVSSHYFLTIHPESLGMLLQCVGLIFLLDVSKKSTFTYGKFIFAVVFFSLSALAKQPFFIVNVIIGLVFFVWLYKEKKYKLQVADIIKLMLYSTVVFLLVFFIIHPYAFLQYSLFLNAQSELSAGHSSVALIDALSIWGVELSNSVVFCLNLIILLFLLFFRRVHWIYYCSVILTMLCALLFVYKARTFISLLYLYPLYMFAIFNILYYGCNIIDKISNKYLKRVLVSVGLLIVSFNAFSNVAYSVFSSHYRYFTDGLGTKYVAWDYIKSIRKTATVAYSPDVAMPEPYKANGCHAWQGCDGYDSLGKFDPDLVVLSPDYPHYNFAEYDKYVSDNNYQLIKFVEPDFSIDSYKCTSGLMFGIARTNMINPPVFNFLHFNKLLKNVATCMDNYSFVLDNYNKKSISGLPKYIYKK